MLLCNVILYKTHSYQHVRSKNKFWSENLLKMFFFCIRYIDIVYNYKNYLVGTYTELLSFYRVFNQGRNRNQDTGRPEPGLKDRTFLNKKYILVFPYHTNGGFAQISRKGWFNS